MDDTQELLTKGIHPSISKSKVEPIYGSPIYTDLMFGKEAHSGIYIGDNKVVALRGDGEITESSLLEFTSHPTTVHQHIYVPYFKDNFDFPIGFASAGFRAMEMVGNKRRYNILIDNCHQFCSGYLTGNFENTGNFLWMLKDTIAELNEEAIRWKKWEWR
ncbi:hypothetical protein ABFY59_26505 [Priestia aryabhattai]|uniref:hypothetical protein n=1 Tax=Priestia aryabhattai TaxID=412384 RepID=UPI003D2AA6A1